MRATGVVALALVAAMASTARADDRLGASFGQQLTQELTELGNLLGVHVGALSHDLFALEVDAAARRARVRVGGGDVRFLAFELAGDIEFVDGLARVATTIDLGIAGRTLHLELPAVDMAPTAYRGERGVEIRLPFLRRTF